MRPTNLCFRSPKEHTPGPNHPLTTSTGTPLFAHPSALLTPSFSQEKRFTQYETAARRTGMRVGPGAYDVDRRDWSPAAAVYRPVHGGVDTSHNGYVMIGDQMMFEAALLLPTKQGKNPLKSIQSRADPFYALHTSTPKRPTSARPLKTHSSRTPSVRSPFHDSISTPDKLFKAKASKRPLRRIHLEERIDRLLEWKEAG